MTEITACIIMHNSEQYISKCLESIKPIVNNIVVIDNGSSDTSVELAKKITPLVYTQKTKNQIDLYNFAVSCSPSDWILWIYPNESCSDVLRNDIFSIQESETLYNGFFVVTKLFYCGRWILRSHFAEPEVRLFQKSKIIWKESFTKPVVSFVNTSPKIGKLVGELYQFSFKTIDEHIHAISHESDKRAAYLSKLRYKKSDISFLFSMIISFKLYYFFKKGFYDGWRGFALCGMNSISQFLSHIKAKQYLNE